MKTRMVACFVLEHLLGHRCGGSTGANFHRRAATDVGDEGSRRNWTCGHADLRRRPDTHYNDAWLMVENLDIVPACARLQRIVNSCDS